MPLTRKPSSLTPTFQLDPSPSTSAQTRHTPSLSGQASFHSMESTVDSGYASSSGWLSPHPDYVLSRTYENWKIADAAAQRLVADLRALEDCKAQLRAAKKRRNQEQKSPKPNRKPSLLQLPFGKRGSLKASDVSPSPSPPEAGPSTDMLPSVEVAEAQLEQLNNRITATQPAAERLDTYFEELRRVLDDGRPVSWRSSAYVSDGYGHSYTDEYTKARRTVGARDQAYQDSKATTKALQHACNAIQSSHHHYLKAMELLDAVCSPKKSRWEAAMGDEQSRQETYREAAEWAKKAQICFNECVKSLQPHWELLKRDELQDYEDLENTGLLQAVQLYKLMYGGKVLAMGITQQVQIMVQKQDAVFARLTNFAVWVQDCTKFCETVELDARESRDGARRHLVALWVKADEESERYSLAAPSEHSHVFVATAR
ncbi:hypothetical protein L227DRAFT_511669 [Lentinus tigrinus ALCF2SS1-6]|uniref:Uncharacterized protein n=1 Tax=Lentinus tigrinus ALCF2SS1-6 TaxID=1328759 RepID=A0A5C2RT35_9APHY|nr:hypothetical protein L227DRAFT_511669 [Lentinus tigrinus ALCF2SS1-6]